MRNRTLSVSAIIPTFNRRQYIMRAIDSVLRQTVPVNEVIVVDDGSTDGTAEAVRSRYGTAIRVISQPNAGVSGARARGIQEAREEWTAFLDSDDEWTPDRNGRFVEALGTIEPDVAWIFGDLRVVTDAGEGPTLFEQYGLHVTRFPEVFADTLSVHFPFQFGLLQGSLIRRSVLVELGCFTQGLRSDDDLLAGFQVACRYRFAAIPCVVGKYYRTSDLMASSVVMNGVNGLDYFRSRMMAFALVVESGRRYPWNMRYAEVVRGLHKLLTAQGRPVPRRLALQQFRYGGLSLKGVAYLGAALLGASGLRAWNAVAGFRRAHGARTS